jgi:rod shape determining protein RodA
MRVGSQMLRRLDWPVVVAVFALIIFSWPYMKSASYRSGIDGEGYYTSSPEKQIVWIAVGAVAALLMLIPSYRTMSEMGVVVYLSGLAMLVIVMFFGKTINGARSWLVLPANVRLQPSELVKVTTVIALAHYLGRVEKARRMGHVLGALLLAGIPAVMIAKQPDLGTAMMFLPAALAMILVAGARIRHLLILGLATLVMLPMLWMVMTPTQRSRIDVWLGQGRKLTRTERVGRFHHLIQSKVAIGSGGWTGLGLGQGKQNRLNYLGFRNTDFIFAVICEEAGFLGATVIILIYVWLAGAGLSIAQRCREPVGRLIAVGVIMMFVFQGFINIAMTVGMVPIVGVTLPFVSYGGSSTLASFLGISLLLNVGLRRPKITFSSEELSTVAAGFRS